MSGCSRLTLILLAGLRLLKIREIVRILGKLGFALARQKGSHAIFKHSDGRFTIVPIHGDETIDRGLLRKIIKESGSTPEEFEKLA